VDAFAAAARNRGQGGTVVASLPEDLPEEYAAALMAQGIAPMHGIPDCLDAIAHAARIGVARAQLAQLQPLAEVVPLTTESARHAAKPPQFANASKNGASSATSHTLDEAAGKQALAAFGLPVPRGKVVGGSEAADFADSLGYPVVVKAVSAQLAHKTEAGGVQLNVQNAQGVRAAVHRMAALSDRFLVEQMASQVVAEIIVGVQRDDQFGLSLTLGAGGILVELLQDAQTLLFPVARADVQIALQSLKAWPLLSGFRGRPPGDVPALVDAVLAIAAYAQAHADRLVELDVNPVLVLPAERGVLAVDALIRLTGDVHG
jgi:acetyl-CoA synthetase